MLQGQPKGTVAAPGLTKSAPSKLDSERCLQCGAPPTHMENGRPIHLETDGHWPSPREGGLGLEWTGPEQDLEDLSSRRGKKGKGRQSWLVCCLHRLVKGTLAHTTISTHHSALTGSPRQQSRNRETRQLPASPLASRRHQGLWMPLCHTLAPSLPPGSVAL